MEWVSKRRLKNRPREIWQLLKKVNSIIITDRGKPEALMIDLTSKESLDAALKTIKRIKKALDALNYLQKLSEEKGLDKLTSEEIEREIIESRKAKSSS